MSIISSYYVYRILRLLTTDWKDLPAFKMGVIDAEGNRLIPDTDLTPAQADTVGLLEKLVFNLKRLLKNIPGGQSKIGAYAAALWLIRESADLDPISAGVLYDHVEANGLKPEEMVYESVKTRFSIGSRVRFTGWVDVNECHIGVTTREGKITGRASSGDIDGNAVFYVESAGLSLAVSSRVMEEVGAAAAGDGGGDSGTKSGNVAGNIKGVDKKLKAGGMVRRKMETNS